MSYFLRSLYIILFILSFGSIHLFGQIQIAQQDIQALIGKKFNTVGDTGLVVNVGSSGVNQIWDFTGLNPQGVEWVTEYLTPSNTPFAEDFPSANWVEKSQVTFEGFEGTLYHYRRVESSSFSSLGDGMIFGELTQVNQDESENIPLPVQYGSQWGSESVDTLFAVQGMVTLSRYKTETVADGWGKVKLSSGEFDALRLRDIYFDTYEMWINGELQSADTTQSIGYTWVSKNVFVLASIGSREGEEDLNFTMAGEVFLHNGEESGTGLAAGAVAAPSDYQLYQNYPNPFNPQTTIDFSLPATSDVEIVVFDTQGKKVTTLVSGTKSAGNHSVSWNAANYTSGIYYYAIRAGEFSQTRKMILVK